MSRDELSERIRLLDAERLRPVPAPGEFVVVFDPKADEHLAVLKSEIAAMEWGGAPTGSGAGQVRK